ncbi:unnamed protein product [Zymoseptoria tritici ST99CH_3D1]|nr:unnamed protein product [Zymoseptoria tritici ST99CH_3D1]
MRPLLALILTVLLGSTTAAVLTKDGKQICPLQGQQFPVPTNLSQDSIFNEALQSLEATLHANISQTPYNETTFSIGVFSANDEDLLWEFHHADELVKNSSLGANDVDADSVYRVASISKILTIYLWLIHDGDRRLNDPIIEYVPELATGDAKGRDYAVPDWSEITVGDLMMYLAGIGRDYGLNDVAIKNSVTEYLSADTVQMFMSSGPPNEKPVCGYFKNGYDYIACKEDNYIQAVANLAAVFAPGYTPMYSNANWAILGYALEKLAGEEVEAVFNSSLVEALGLTGTSYTTPKIVTKHAVIPNGNVSSSSWDDELGPLAAAAGAYSTTNDLAKIGRAILNSTLTSKAVTRRWFSTSTFVDSLDQAAGRGWEIFRREVNGHTVDVYTKAGNWGSYTSVFALIPSYNIGFSILSTSSSAHGKLTASLPNLLITTLLTALEASTRSQATHNFAGTYTDPTANSTLTLTLDTSPGLKVTAYTSAGVDLLSTVFGRPDYVVDFRIVPNQLYDRRGSVGFTGIYALPEDVPKNGDFYWPCQNWLDIDDYTFGNVPLGQMVFEVDSAGRACGVRLVALGMELERVQLPFLTEYCEAQGIGVG